MNVKYCFLLIVVVVTNIFANDYQTQDNSSMLIAKGQVFEGSYKCGSSRTNLTIEITSVVAAQVESIFEFKYKRTRGRFSLVGSYDSSTGKLVLKPNKWIDRPSGYSMVGMTGLLSGDGTVYEGRIDYRGCGAFKVTLKEPPVVQSDEEEKAKLFMSRKTDAKVDPRNNSKQPEVQSIEHREAANSTNKNDNSSTLKAVGAPDGEPSTQDSVSKVEIRPKIKDRWELAIPAVFMSEPYAGYGKSITLVPSEKHIQSFPLLAHSGPDRFFEIGKNPNLIQTVTAMKAKSYADLVGFDQYYRTIMQLSPYQLKAKEEEVLTALDSVFLDYRQEYTTYMDTLFTFQVGVYDIEERTYDFDKQEIKILLDLPGPLKTPDRRPGAMSIPGEQVLRNFDKQGFANQEAGVGFFTWQRVYIMPLSLEMAERFFSHLNGVPGERIGLYSIQYWVKPAGGTISGTRLMVSSMELVRVEIKLLGKTGFRVALSEFEAGIEPNVAILEFK